MPWFPNGASVLLKTSSLFASPGLQASQRRRFEEGEVSLDTMSKLGSVLLSNIMDALGIQPEADAGEDAVRCIDLLLKHVDTLSQHVTTFGAFKEQVLWTLASQDLAAGLGRSWGLWNVAYETGSRLPGGPLWFLPRRHPKKPDRLILPVEVVARWWRSQIEGPIDRIWDDDEGNSHRLFQQWHNGDATPQPEKIVKLFGESRCFRYRPDVTPHPKPVAVRRLLLIARAIETAWKDLVQAVTPGVSPHDPDPMRNKSLQLVELFRQAHDITVRHASPDIQKADTAFRSAVPVWLANGPFHSIMPDASGSPPSPEEAAGRLSKRFMELAPNAQVRDLFLDASLTSPAQFMPDDQTVADRTHFVSLLAEGFKARASDHDDRRTQVRWFLEALRENPREEEFEVGLLLLTAYDHLSAGKLAAAKKVADRAFAASRAGGHGPWAIEAAWLKLALAVATDAFEQKESEAPFRIILRAVQPEMAKEWDLGHAPVEYSMRLAAVYAHERLWNDFNLPYPGVLIEHPLLEASLIIEEYFELAALNPEEGEVGAFVRRHKAVLKRKLRDIRGDTFFTMIAKMSLDLMRRVEDLRPGPEVDENDRTTFLEHLRKTLLNLARAMPSDMLEAQDFRRQTALMIVALHGEAELVRVLLEKQVSVDVQDTLGQTALHAAVLAGSIECFEQLLPKIDLRLKTCEGKTAPVLAAELGRIDIVKSWLASPLSRRVPEIKESHDRASEAAAHYERTRAEFMDRGVMIGSQNDYRSVIGILADRLP